MKALLLVFPLVLLSCASASANDFSLRDGTKLTGVTVSRAEPDGLVIVTDDGIIKVPFSNLDEETQKKYNFDPQEAAKFNKAVGAAAAAADIAAQRARAAAAAAAVQMPAPGPGPLDPGPHVGKVAAKDPANPEAAGLPFPLEGHQFTLTELNKYRDDLAGNVVWVKLTPTRFDHEIEDGQCKVFVRDTKSKGDSVDNYEFVWFPPAGEKKMEVMEQTSRNALSFYVKVEKDRLTAVGRSKNVDSFHGTFSYTW